MATLIRFKRGTLAQLNTAAGNNGLVAGEPYLVTDIGAFALATSDEDFDLYVKVGELLSGATKIEIVSSLPGSPDNNTIYIVTT